MAKIEIHIVDHLGGKIIGLCYDWNKIWPYFINHKDELHTSTLHDARSASELSSSDGILQILPFLSNSSLPQRWHLAQLSHIGPRYKDTRHITTVELNDSDEENIGYQIAELFSKMQDLEKLYRI